PARVCPSRITPSQICNARISPARVTRFQIQVGALMVGVVWAEFHASRICDPPDAPRSDSGDAELDGVAVAQFLRTLLQQTDQRAVYVAVAEEAEVVSADGEVLERRSCKVLKFQSFNVSKLMPDRLSFRDSGALNF